MCCNQGFYNINWQSLNYLTLVKFQRISLTQTGFYFFVCFTPCFVFLVDVSPNDQLADLWRGSADYALSWCVGCTSDIPLNKGCKAVTNLSLNYLRTDYCKETEPLYHYFMYLLVSHFFLVSIQYLQCNHCLCNDVINCLKPLLWIQLWSYKE